jgi:hypothetical protein
MENGEDESEVKQRRAQDLIETIAPPRAKRSVEATGDATGSEEGPEIDWGDHLPGDDLLDAGRAVSPDDIPTERPPWSDPAESRERLMPGVPIPPEKKNA